jgi:hypothetical protein
MLFVLFRILLVCFVIGVAAASVSAQATPDPPTQYTAQLLPLSAHQPALTGTDRAVTVIALRSARVFEEPLIATTSTSSEEDSALSKAIAAYKTQAVADDFTVFEHFLAQYPQSGWRVALLTTLGLAYYHYRAVSALIFRRAK